VTLSIDTTSPFAGEAAAEEVFDDVFRDRIERSSRGGSAGIAGRGSGELAFLGLVEVGLLDDRREVVGEGGVLDRDLGMRFS